MQRIKKTKKNNKYKTTTQNALFGAVKHADDKHDNDDEQVKWRVERVTTANTRWGIVHAPPHNPPQWPQPAESVHPSAFCFL